MHTTKDGILEQLRTICLTLPETGERDAGSVGSPSFRVRSKIFAMRHFMDDRPSLWFKAAEGVQGMLVNAEPERFFVPPYVGRYGWIGLWLDGDVDWDEAKGFIRDSYRLIAPKRLWLLVKAD
jgi:hypothetical protein